MTGHNLAARYQAYLFIVSLLALGGGIVAAFNDDTAATLVCAVGAAVGASGLMPPRR